MKEFNEIEVIASLLAKKISKRLTQDEKILLEDWQNKSVKNKRILARLLDENNIVTHRIKYSGINTEQGWSKVTQKIQKTRPKIRILNILKYAAVILLPISIALGTYLYFYPTQKIDQIAINPGIRNATLILNDGESVNLESLEKETLNEKDGTIIKKVDDELNYNVSEKNKNDAYLKNTLIVPRGSEYSLVLSDGTRVYVNSMSKMVYPVQFGKNNRIVSLEGEAYFEVQKDQSRPFLVNIHGMQVRVTGTSFNIKAYSDDSRTYTTLIEGQVKVSLENQPHKEITLNPNQQAILDKEKQNIDVQQVDAHRFIQWKNGIYSFNDQPLEEIMQTLSRWYDCEYRFEDESLKKLRFEGGLNKYEKIDPIIDIIQSTGKVRVKVEGKEILFVKQK